MADEEIYLTFQYTTPDNRTKSFEFLSHTPVEAPFGILDIHPVFPIQHPNHLITVQLYHDTPLQDMVGVVEPYQVNGYKIWVRR